MTPGRTIPAVRAPLSKITAAAGDALVAMVDGPLRKYRGDFVRETDFGAADPERFAGRTVAVLAERSLVDINYKKRGIVRASLTSAGRWYAATILADRAETLATASPAA